MIIVQDKIETAATNLAAIKQCLMNDYRPDAETRGLIFVDAIVSPPLAIDSAPVTLWLRWQVADAPSWWAMRAQSGTPEVMAVWRQVDALCISRERLYMLSSDESDCPLPDDLSPFKAGIHGYRETAQLRLKASIGDDARPELEQRLANAAAKLPGIRSSLLSANLMADYAAGDYTWDILFDSESQAVAARHSEQWQKTVEPLLDNYFSHRHALALQTIDAGLRQPDLRNPVKRTAFFRMLPGKAHLATQFESVLLEMPAQIPQIVNWRLSKARPLPWDTADCTPWDYVWEQEFVAVDDLNGPYMMHPHHWSYVDRWFHHESGVQAIDADLSHAFCMMDSSILTLESR